MIRDVERLQVIAVVALANHTGLSERQLREAQTVVEAHIEELNDAWNQHFKT